MVQATAQSRILIASAAVMHSIRHFGAQSEHPDASFILASAAEMHGRLRQWPEARGLAARAADLAPADASPLQARDTFKHSR